jgi:hypothetical protein
MENVFISVGGLGYRDQLPGSGDAGLLPAAVVASTTA